jgi:hypothetical protein
MERFVLDSFIIPDFEKFASGIFRFTPRAKKRLAFGEKNGKIKYRPTPHAQPRLSLHDAELP